MKRFLSAVLAIVLLGMCIACQPTPEEEFVTQKDARFIKEKLSAVPAPDEGSEEGAETYTTAVEAYKATLPTHWSDYIETEFIKMPIEAEIIVENTNGFPVYKIKRGTFDMELASSIANQLMPNVTGIREGWVPLPEEFAAAIRSLNQRGMTEYAEFMFEESQNAEPGEYMEADCIALPSEGDPRYVIQYGDGKLGQVFTKSTRTQACRMDIGSSFYSSVYLGEMVEFDGSYAGGEPTPVNPSITQEEARKVLDAFLQKNGLEIYHVDKITDMQYFDNLIREEVSQGWQFYLVPSYEYYALDAVNGRDGSWLRLNLVDGYAATWNQESLYVYITENGVEYVQWNYPFAFLECVNPSVELMDFGEIQKKFLNLLSAGISWFEQPCVAKPTVTKVVLTVVPQQMKDDPDTAYLMPVWVCVIDWYCAGAASPHMEDLLALNAIDGSRVSLG